MNTSMTVSAAELDKTYETDETYTPTNGEFMLAVFGPLDAEDPNPPRPVIVSFEESPWTAPKKTWYGKAWNGQAAGVDALNPDANNYSTMATYFQSSFTCIG